MYDFEILVYDETEYFRDYNSPEFNYAYEPRKTKLHSIPIKFIIDQVEID